MNLPEFTPLRSIGAPSTEPLITIEVNPPRGTEVDSIFDRLDGQLEGIDFFNVTDSALAKMRMAPVPFAALLKNRYGIEPLVNFSCRDRNLIAIQGDLLAGWALGIRSIVALTGDAVTIGDAPETKGVFEVNSVGLLHIIEKLNSGFDAVGHPLKGAPELIPGVVVNPNARNAQAELRRLQRKKEAGATYALSQPVFDIDGATAFFSQAANVGVPIFAGLLPLKTVRAAQSIGRVPGIRLSGSVVEVLDRPPEDDVAQFFVEHCLGVAQAIRPLVRGFHVISGTTPKLSLELARELVRSFKDKRACTSLPQSRAGEEKSAISKEGR